VAETEDFEEARGEYCFATLHQAARRMPLRLEWDELRELDEGNVVKPTACPCISLLEEDDGMQQAAALMANYNDGSNSWISHHLNLSSALAFKIRQFVTPSPVFYVEKDDLVLKVEETTSAEFNKVLIFRKTVNTEIEY